MISVLSEMWMLLLGASNHPVSQRLTLPATKYQVVKLEQTDYEKEVKPLPSGFPGLSDTTTDR